MNYFLPNLEMSHDWQKKSFFFLFVKFIETKAHHSCAIHLNNNFHIKKQLNIQENAIHKCCTNDYFGKYSKILEMQ